MANVVSTNSKFGSFKINLLLVTKSSRTQTANSCKK